MVRVGNQLKLSEEGITDTLGRNRVKFNLTDQQRERWHKKCLVLVDLRGWKGLSLRSIRTSGEYGPGRLSTRLKRTSIPYNYEKSRLEKAWKQI